jgi:hypothetical protein
MYLVPESPIHLLNIGKKKEAIEALVWLRGADDPDQIQSELAKVNKTCMGSSLKVRALNNQ